MKPGVADENLTPRRKWLLGICSGGGTAQDHKSQPWVVNTFFFFSPARGLSIQIFIDSKLFDLGVVFFGEDKCHLLSSFSAGTIASSGGLT